MVVVAVSGPPGSGKSTVARAVAEKFGLRYVSAGTIFRNLAAELGVGLDELSRMAERDHGIDRRIDEETLKEEEKGNVVLDGHLTAWVVRNAIRIYVKASREERFARISRRDGVPMEEAVRVNSVREDSERARFKAIYGIDVGDLNSFDLVIDTTYLSPEDASQTVIDFLSRNRKFRGGNEGRATSKGRDR